MNALWPWLLVAGAGALHGLHPASGWPLASACVLRGRDWRRAAGAMLPLAAGHAVAVMLFAAAVMYGLRWSPPLLAGVAAAGLLAAVAHRCLCRHAQPARERVPSLGLGLAAFLLAHAHGAGWLLLPALLPLCTTTTVPHAVVGLDPRLATTLAVVAVHTLAMAATAVPLAIGGGLLARRAAAGSTRRAAGHEPRATFRPAPRRDHEAGVQPPLAPPPPSGPTPSG